MICFNTNIGTGSAAELFRKFLHVADDVVDGECRELVQRWPGWNESKCKRTNLRDFVSEKLVDGLGVSTSMDEAIEPCRMLLNRANHSIAFVAIFSPSCSVATHEC